MLGELHDKDGRSFGELRAERVKLTGAPLDRL
jgi:hypothetical protein